VKRAAVLLLLVLAVRPAVTAEPLLLPALGGAQPRLDRLLLLDAATAGGRIVAVGERGRILLSDDDGHSWRFGASPTETTLVSVFFVDDTHGWAVGHDAVILRSEDGGASWQQVYVAPDENAPLLDVWFRDAEHGWAVGAYGMALQTVDGGRSWERIQVDAGDRHLNALAGSPDGKIYIVGESGTILRSDDNGRVWTKLVSPYGGSYFGVLVLPGGNPLIFGMRGKVFRGGAHGESWQAIAGGADASLQGGRVTTRGEVLLVGNDGVILVSRDGGKTFSERRARDRKAIAAVLPLGESELLLFGESGLTRFAGAGL